MSSEFNGTGDVAADGGTAGAVRGAVDLQDVQAVDPLNVLALIVHSIGLTISVSRRSPERLNNLLGPVPRVRKKKRRVVRV